MQNAAHPYVEGNHDPGSLYLASMILLDISRTIDHVQAIAAALLGLGALGVSIANNLIGFFTDNTLERS